MLTHPTSKRLGAPGLAGMARALDEQRRAGPTFEALGFKDRLGLLVDREAAERDTKRLTARLKFAALRQTASVEDLDLARTAWPRPRRHGASDRSRMDRSA